MEASELRIGNLALNQTGELKDVPVGKPVKITIDNIRWAEFYVPIPLSEEWLIKFGFERKEQESILDYPTWWKEDSEYLFEADGEFYHSFVVTENNKINYVHQLQNLYFSLTGEELEVK